MTLRFGIPNLIAMNTTDSEIIDQLGGTGRVASIFGITNPTVSEWRERGIPTSRKQTLAMLFPDQVPADWAPPGARMKKPA